MAALRRLTSVQRRLLLALFLGALLVRALVPAGWMPSPTGGLMICDGMARAMPSAHGHGKHEAPAPDRHAADHPCAFAGAVASMTPVQVGPVFPAAIAPRAAATRYSLGPGRGLAAPPPPPTGPPSFA